MSNEVRNPEELKLMLLRRAQRKQLPRLMGPGGHDVVLCSELTDDGYLDSWVTLGVDGKPCMVADPRITQLGEEFLDQQQPFEMPMALNERMNLLKPIGLSALLALLAAFFYGFS